MPRIKVTMEAEVGDLQGFWPDEPTGVTSFNTIALFRNMQVKTLEFLMDNAAARELDPRTKVAHEKALREDLALAERLLATAKVEVLT